MRRRLISLAMPTSLSPSLATPVAQARRFGTLGYRDIGGTYHHDKNLFTLEFPPGPLAIGGDIVRSYETVARDNEILYVLSRTDCVRDRLAAFFFLAIAAP